MLVMIRSQSRIPSIIKKKKQQKTLLYSLIFAWIFELVIVLPFSFHLFL